MRLSRRRVAAASIVLIGLAVTGCAGEPAPAETVTVTATATATVTATPEPVTQQPDDALTPLEAWALCAAVAQVDDLRPEYWAVGEFDPELVTGGAEGSYNVLVGFAPLADQTGGARSECQVDGTIGQPSVTYLGTQDFG